MPVPFNRLWFGILRAADAPFASIRRREMLYALALWPVPPKRKRASRDGQPSEGGV
jgi:hypothetical protein